MGGAVEVRESIENECSEVSVPDFDGVAQVAVGLSENQADPLPERGSESDGQKHKAHRPGLSKPCAFPASDIVIHGGPTAVLSTLRHA